MCLLKYAGVRDSLKETKFSKSAGIDGLTAEHAESWPYP